MQAERRRLIPLRNQFISEGKSAKVKVTGTKVQLMVDNAIYKDKISPKSSVPDWILPLFTLDLPIMTVIFMTRYIDLYCMELNSFVTLFIYIVLL